MSPLSDDESDHASWSPPPSGWHARVKVSLPMLTVLEAPYPSTRKMRLMKPLERFPGPTAPGALDRNIDADLPSTRLAFRLGACTELPTVSGGVPAFEDKLSAVPAELLSDETDVAVLGLPRMKVPPVAA